MCSRGYPDRQSALTFIPAPALARFESTTSSTGRAFSTLRATTGCFFPCPLYDRSGSQELDTLKTVANAGARQLEEPFWVTGYFDPVSSSKCHGWLFLTISRQFEEPFWVTGYFDPVSSSNCHAYYILTIYHCIAAILRAFFCYRVLWPCVILKLLLHHRKYYWALPSASLYNEDILSKEIIESLTL